MLGIEHDAVLIVIYIWRILEKPVTVVNRQWNDAVVLACRMVDTSCISLIFLTELALRIRALLCIFAAAMAFGSFSGLDRLMVISSVPNSVSVVHLRSF